MSINQNISPPRIGINDPNNVSSDSIPYAPASNMVSDSPPYAQSDESPPYAPGDKTDSDWSNTSWYGPKYVKKMATPMFISPEEDGSYYVESANEKDFSDYYDAIDNYYNYKSQYDTAKKNIQSTIISNNPDASWNKRRNLYKITKPPCINCKRRVGTIFSIDYDISDDILKTEPRILKAACGDNVAPCQLDIQIMIPNTTTFDSPIVKLKKVIKVLQNDIIKEKNDSIFGYTPKEIAIQNFKTTTGALSSLIERYESLISLYEYVANADSKNITEITDTGIKQQSLNEIRILFYNTLEVLNNYINEFKKTNDDHFISDAVSLYIDDLIVQAEEIRKLNYAISTVEFNNTDATYSLIQQKMNLPKNQVSLRANTKIIKYVIDNETVVSAKNKKQSKPQNPSVPLNPLNKSVPQKPRLIIESSSASEPNENVISLRTNGSESLSEVSSDNMST